MNIKIKKWVIFSSLGLVSIGTGIFLFMVLIEALGAFGVRGYLLLGIFIVSVIFYIVYEMRVRRDYKIANEVVEEVASEYKEQLDPEELRTAKQELRKRLMNIVHDESYTFFKKNKPTKSARHAVEAQKFLNALNKGMIAAHKDHAHLHPELQAYSSIKD